MIEFLVKNWALLIAMLSILVVAIITVINFFKKPTEEQWASVRSWLLFAVTKAEKELGSGTGKLKLRYVYDWFLTKFPYLAPYISFNQFSEFVDQALEEMKALISQNKQIESYVNSGNANLVSIES